MIDDFTREGLGIEVDFSLPSGRGGRSLDQIIEWRGKPGAIRCDNGPRYISNASRVWADKRGIRLEPIQPGKPQLQPTLNGIAVQSLRWGDQHLFESIDEVQDHDTRWLWTFSSERPNMDIGGMPPMLKLRMAT